MGQTNHPFRNQLMAVSQTEDQGQLMKRRSEKPDVSTIKGQLNTFRFAAIVPVVLFLAMGQTAEGANWKDFFFKERISRETTRRQQEIDQMALAVLMIKDGYYDRAEAVLNTIDVDEQDTSLDLVKYFTLRGLVDLWQSQYENAEQYLLKAIGQGQEDQTIYLYLAQAYFGQQKYAQTLQALGQAEKNGTMDDPSIFTMKAQCHWFLDQKEQALIVLDKAIQLFPENRDFVRQRLYYLIDLDLFCEALDSGLDYLSLKGNEDDFIALGEALRQTRQLDNAKLVLEAARLKYPENEQVMVALGHVYLDSGQFLVAAHLFETASHYNEKYIEEAAEVYRRAGNYYRALLLNMRVSDQKIKTRQRLGILLDLERFEEAISLEPRLSRLGLLDDDNIKYAMAYTYYQTGQSSRVKNYLKHIQRSDLFQAAAELLKIMNMKEQQLDEHRPLEQ